MKYQRLELSQLELLSKEFVQFLALNGIIAEDWEKIKINQRNKMNLLLDQFSEMVWETTIQESAYYLLLQEKEWIAFHCSMDTMQMLNLRLENAHAFSFLDYDTLNAALSYIPEEATKNTFSSTRPFKTEDVRNNQVYTLLKSGYKIIQKEQWELLIATIERYAE
jgi:hypothetical protein